MTDVLIIEDNDELRTLIRDFLIGGGLNAVGAGSAEEGIEFLEENSPRLILLDIMLPGISGFDMCSAIRAKKDIPIIIMSAANDEESKLLGYKLGADDYIDKPVSVSVLLAKVKALIHRSEADVRTGDDISCCGITINMAKHTVYKNGERIDISGKLYDLLLYMMSHKGVLLDKDELYRDVWGDTFGEPQTLNVHIRWLREQIEDDPGEPRIIRTVWRKGYIFGDED